MSYDGVKHIAMEHVYISTQLKESCSGYFSSKFVQTMQNPFHILDLTRNTLWAIGDNTFT